MLLTEDAVSILFSYTRSYFQVQVERPFDLVGFLQSIIPKKRKAEIYNQLGYDKHGKTELYRDLLRELNNSQHRFELAPGTPGLVMIASRLGMPVSTTHVSCGSLFGIGLVNGHCHLNVIGQILLAWLATLPVAATIGWIGTSARCRARRSCCTTATERCGSTSASWPSAASGSRTPEPEGRAQPTVARPAGLEPGTPGSGTRQSE